MSLREEFKTGLKEAMKSKDTIRVSTLRLVMTALKDRDLAAREKNQPDGIPDPEILSMLQSMIKQRQESAKTYSESGREDLAEREEAEVDVIRCFMPAQLSEQETQDAISALVEELGAESIKDMGRVMAALKTRYAGQVDMSKAGGLVKGKLA